MMNNNIKNDRNICKIHVYYIVFKLRAQYENLTNKMNTTYFD